MASEEPSGSSSAVAPAPAPAEAIAPDAAPAPTEDKAASPPTETKAPAKKAKTKEGKTKTKAKAKAKVPENVHPDDDPSLWIYTSLTAGNMHIVTATSRLETILRANRVPFKAVDIAVDARARILWGKRAGKAADGRQRKLPGLVQMGQVLGDMVEIEEWNEYGELKQHVKIYFDEFTQPPKGSIAPVPKYKQPEDKLPHPPAVLNFPPAPEREKSAAEEHANKLAQAVREAGAAQNRGVAEEAAQRGKQMEQQAKKAKLQALKEKAQGAKREAEGGDAKEGAGSAEPPTGEMAQLSVATDATPSAAEAGAEARAGLQSPTSGAWKDSGNGASMGEALRTVQSPTSSSWVPPAESSLTAGAQTFAGARVASVGADEIAKVESQTMIKEEPEEEAVA